MYPVPFRLAALGFVIALLGLFVVGALSPSRNSDVLPVVGVIIAAVVVVALVLWMRRAQRRDERARIRRTRTIIDGQLGAVATDILELEEGVRAVGNDEALRHFRRANTTYTEVSKELATAATAAELGGLAARLDEAIWQLDATEALLEGSPPPPRPQIGTLSTPATPEPVYRRRPGRRSCMGVSNLIAAVLEEDAALPNRGTVPWDRHTAGDGRVLELRRRYAAGEITTEEFEMERHRLGGRQA